MRNKKFLTLTLAAAAVAVFFASGCKGAAEFANKALDKANQGLALKSTHEYMLAWMSTDYGRIWNLSTPKLQNVLKKIAKSNLKTYVKSGSERKRIKKLPASGMYVEYMNAKIREAPYPKLSNYKVKNDASTFSEKKAEVVVVLTQTLEDKTKADKEIMLVLHDVGDAWLVDDIQDAPEK